MTGVPGRGPGEPGGTHRRRDPLTAVPRAAVAVLVLAALAWSSLEAARDGTLPQHVSFFTNQSNFAFALVMLAMALLPQARHPRWWEHLRGAVVFYLAMTGIIYALLVAPLDELLRWDIGWTGIVLHRVAPVVAVLDWLLTPRRSRPRPVRLLVWQGYPVLFLALTWIRGAVTGWYPYDFLDPTASSWGQVLVTTAVVLVAFLTVALGIHLLQGRLVRRRPAPRDGGSGVRSSTEEPTG
ncbi:Pr6Pr family membrane protein [Brachybacterium sp. J144]|uniref:Pr6Pr family membrane protein n=1 Tax=Brachybacterium sp. J144 TaxID=3116487 RepID=UPI002E76BF88|nr:Pr6Pr family membrane protein [Brachybacterium sp. J144]MEE1649680.1 Pr6Pr family membrane protein [Brachybacterium sp. J144]